MSKRKEGTRIFHGSAKPNERDNAETEKDRFIKALTIEFRKKQHRESRGAGMNPAPRQEARHSPTTGVTSQYLMGLFALSRSLTCG